MPQESLDPAGRVEPAVAGLQELAVTRRETDTQPLLQLHDLFGGRAGTAQPTGDMDFRREGLGPLLLVQDRVQPLVAPSLQQLTPCVSRFGCGAGWIRHGGRLCHWSDSSLRANLPSRRRGRHHQQINRGPRESGAPDRQRLSRCHRHAAGAHRRGAPALPRSGGPRHRGMLHSSSSVSPATAITAVAASRKPPLHAM